MMGTMIFQQDVMLTRPEQERARKKMFHLMHKIGFNSGGAEFIFFNTRQCKNLEKLEQKAKKWSGFLAKTFDEVYMSVHAPWLPNGTTNLIDGAGLEIVKKIALFCSDSIGVVNIHVGMGIPHPHWKKKYFSVEQKQDALESIAENLEELTDINRNIAVEVMPARDLKEDGIHFFYLAKDFEYLTKKNKKVGITVDTCHTGITKVACKQVIETGKFPPGFYPSELPEITAAAQDPDAPFLRMKKRLVHLHYSDFGKSPKIEESLHGAVPGEGARPLSETINTLKRYEQALPKKTGVTLEINETNYTTLSNMKKTLLMLKKQGYH